MTEKERIAALLAVCEAADLGCLPMYDLEKLTKRAVHGACELWQKAARIRAEADRVAGHAAAVGRAAMEFGGAAGPMPPDEPCPICGEAHGG